MQHRKQWIVVLLVIASLQLAACAQKPAMVEKIQPAKLEEIEGTDFKRVILTEKAAERIGLSTTAVREAEVTRQREVSGKIMTSSSDTETGTILVRVPLIEADLATLDRSRPVVVLPFDDDSEDEGTETEELEAEEVDDIEDEDDNDNGTVLYFSISKTGKRPLAAEQPVRVRLPLISSIAQHKIIPYQAVIYDVTGGTWVYVKEADALAFVRQSITIDYIEGDIAYLTDGPPVGAEVVIVGGAELYGTETGVSK